MFKHALTGKERQVTPMENDERDIIELETEDGGTVQLNLTSPADNGSFFNYETNVVVDTAYVNNAWQVSISSATEGYALPRYDKLVGSWNGSCTDFCSRMRC